MEKLLKEIIDGMEAWNIEQEKRFCEQACRGKGTKQYVIKRIDLLREQLLEMKKELR